MRSFSLICAFLCMFFAINAQSDNQPVGMTQQQLHELIESVGSDVVISGNVVGFTINGIKLACISDVSANRMRILSPIMEVEQVEQQQLILAMAANFHTALDARYAISQDFIYSVFIHPLSSLTEKEVISAVYQVAQASATFGTEYTSGELQYGG